MSESEQGLFPDEELVWVPKGSKILGPADLAVLEKRVQDDLYARFGHNEYTEGGWEMLSYDIEIHFKHFFEELE